MAVTAAPDAFRSVPLVVRAVLTVDQQRRISASAAASREFNRIMRAASRQITIGIQRVSPVKTGLFRRSWVAEVKDRTRVELRNPVRYAQYVHPKRTPRSRTVANVDAPVVIERVQRWLDAELTGELGDALATILLDAAVAPATSTRERAALADARRKFDAWIDRLTGTNAVPGARVRL